MPYRINMTLSGVPNDQYHSGRLACHYLYSFSSAFTSYSEKSDYYTMIFGGDRSADPIALNYEAFPDLRLGPESGVLPLVDGGNYFSFYRREYEEFQRVESDRAGAIRVVEKTYKGPWEPVGVHVNTGYLRDFNITSGRSYQYIICPEVASQKQQFANSLDLDSSSRYGKPVKTEFGEWSLVELRPVEMSDNAPIVKRGYVADLDNIWFFRFALNAGSETQNINKNEVQTLGTFPKVYGGKLNAVSGDVSCLLGSELIPYSDGYVEGLGAPSTRPFRRTRG